MTRNEKIEMLCKHVHERYELAAQQEGWETQERSRVAWEDVPEANKATMRTALSPIVDEIEDYRSLLSLLKSFTPFNDLTPEQWRMMATIE